jgi:hypothetical protein
MLASRFHALGGDGPTLVIQVDFTPRRAEHLAGSRRGQQQEF